MGKAGWIASTMAALSLLLTACDGGGVGGSEGDYSNASADSAKEGDQTTLPEERELTSHGTLIMLECAERLGVTTLRLSGWGSENGVELASVEVELPEGARVAWCEWGDYSGTPGPAGVRQMFDRDFTRVAVTLQVANDTGERAATVNLQTGDVEGLEPVDSFGEAPQDRGAVLAPNTGDLWYIDSLNERVNSRPATGGKIADRGPTQGRGNLVFAGGIHWVWRGSDKIAINPSGTHAALMGTITDEVVLVERDGDGLAAVSGPDIVDSTFADPLPGDLPDTGCQPQLWLDEHRLICATYGHENFSLVTFATDFSSITSTQNLLPTNDRINTGAIASPDGSAIAFLSERGDEQALYVQDVAGGATADPTQLVILPPAAGNRILVEWR